MSATFTKWLANRAGLKIKSSNLPEVEGGLATLAAEVARLDGVAMADAEPAFTFEPHSIDQDEQEN